MRSINAADFSQWLRHGAVGSRITYYQGHLAFDREGLMNLTSISHKHEHVVHHYYEPQHTMAGEVYRAAEQGRVLLFQQRVAPNIFDYIAQKRPTRRHVHGH